MTFEDVRDEARGLTELITEQTGRVLIEEVTVPEPGEPVSELYFVRLVSWGYVLINEAGISVFRELARLLKSSRSDLAKTYQDGKRDIEALRTSLAHNLPLENSSNERTKRLADAWLLQNGAPGDWPAYCGALLQVLKAMLAALREAFVRLCESDDETPSGLDQLLIAVDRAWPPHLFDGIVTELADEIGLLTFDAVAFRKSHQEQWVKLASLFVARDDAMTAMRRVIREELNQTFGPG